MEYINEVFIFKTDFTEISLYKKIVSALSGKGIALASFFGITNIPYQYKICIKTYSASEYKSASAPYHFPLGNIAFSTDQVNILAYKYVKHIFSEDAYTKIILHECIHIFQRIATEIPPTEATWLYESVACYLADQKTNIPTKVANWHNILNDFYNCRDSYAIAYHIGLYIFKNYSKADIFTILKDVEYAKQVGFDAYRSFMS